MLLLLIPSYKAGAQLSSDLCQSKIHFARELSEVPSSLTSLCCLTAFKSNSALHRPTSCRACHEWASVSVPWASAWPPIASLVWSSKTLAQNATHRDAMNALPGVRELQSPTYFQGHPQSLKLCIAVLIYQMAEWNSLRPGLKPWRFEGNLDS